VTAQQAEYNQYARMRKTSVDTDSGLRGEKEKQLGKDWCRREENLRSTRIKKDYEMVKARWIHLAFKYAIKNQKTKICRDCSRE